MSRDDGESSMARGNSLDSELQRSDKLDLNVDQECRSPASKDGCVSDGVLRIGTEFESDEHAYSFYNKYARLVGFSVRKDWVNRSKVHGLVVSRKYTCSKEGYRRKDKRDANVKKHRKETRTGCLAHMIITRQPDGKYRVTHFEAAHNHDSLNLNDHRINMLREELCVGQSVEADSSSNLGVQLNVDSEFKNRQFEVGASLDCLAMEFDNSLPSERMRDTRRGELGKLLRYFQRRHFKNPLFFHAIQVDVDDKVSNIFWADDKMVIDYDYFGDMVCLDTTYRTNKDLQPFVQFIGVNHHHQPIVFAAAFLFDDTVDSLKWLLSTFIEAMCGKKPKIILTDQDTAIIEAITSILPETSHRICVWQMYENAVNHLRHALKDAESFSSDLRSCIYDHSDEEDFVHAWDALLDRYGLEQNEWLKWMFREKEKWAIVYGGNAFFIDAKSSHVAESLCTRLRTRMSSEQHVLHFFKVIERMLDEQRFKEVQANDEMTRCMPRLMGNIVLLKHAIETYTPKAFEIFQGEYEKCLNFVVQQCSESELLVKYKVNKYGKSHKFTVTFNPSGETVCCSCLKFENVGFLCCHALKVLDNRNIKVVPSHYILKRWSKDARAGRPKVSAEFTVHENPKSVIASRYKDLCHRILNISAIAAESEEAFQFASKRLDEMIKEVDKILALKSESQVVTSISPPATGSKCENAEIFLDERTSEDADEDGRVTGIKEKESALPSSLELNSRKEKSFKKKQFAIALPQPPYTVNMVSHSSQASVSTEASMSNPLLQVLYNFEPNQEGQCSYQQQNLSMNPQDDTNLYQQSTFYTGQHESPQQAPLHQAMDLDLQHLQPSSFLLFDNRFRASDMSYLGSKS